MIQCQTPLPSLQKITKLLRDFTQLMNAEQHQRQSYYNTKTVVTCKIKHLQKCCKTFLVGSNRLEDRQWLHVK